MYIVSTLDPDSAFVSPPLWEMIVYMYSIDRGLIEYELIWR